MSKGRSPVELPIRERKQSGGEKVSQLRKCSSSFLISNILENESSDTQPSAEELPPMSRRTGAQSRVRTSGRRRKVGQETLATWESPGVDEGRQFDKWKGQ
ncbi:Hypothetical protein SMAX5B_003749 [Scophthalmus maximus]|uniref:Uncharacterized protein n=1 Tax=Scophthalmus maximus TaxID=52904 RepID=A0A2U9B115_SCOMX|nr:Hypothetical protein SMAX5B_003749 [Scophthalmus maximus]